MSYEDDEENDIAVEVEPDLEENVIRVTVSKKDDYVMDFDLGYDEAIDFAKDLSYAIRKIKDENFNSRCF